MSKKEKIVDRFYSKPKDFTWEELKTFLSIYGFHEQTGAGSRRKFIRSDGKLISLHKPHPKNVIKHYVFDQVIENIESIR